MSGWGMALRLAWRDALRHRGRSLLVLALIALPVLLVSAGAIVTMTADVRGVERIQRELGAAEALVWSDGPAGVVQQPDPHEGIGYVDGDLGGVPGQEEITQVLGEDVELHHLVRAQTDVRLPDGGGLVVTVREADFADPLLEGLVEVVEGRLPGNDREVVVTEDLRGEGFDVGAELAVRDVQPAPVVVGVVEDAGRISGEIAYGLPGSLLAVDDPTRSEPWHSQWLVGGEAVTWDDVTALNGLGFFVFSRAVVGDPPTELQVTYQEYLSGEVDAEMVTVLALIVVMVLIEVVLLAGPAFAVTARSHTRTLALVAASGGTPRQARRVILAGGLVLGLGATLAGTVLSVPLAAAVLPWVQRLSDDRFGPFDVPWPWLAAVAAFGLVSALLAAVVPAWLTSRQDVVAALAGRRGDGAPDLRIPLLGVLVLGAGAAGSAVGATSYDHGPVLMSASAVVTVLGMILVVPAVVAGVARLASRLPLPLRFAARDAARHRTRTVPAVAAVAATVAGVVALGIANASDEKESRETYVPLAAHGTASVGFDAEMAERVGTPPWDELETAVRGAVPDAEVTQVQGLPDSWGEEPTPYWNLGLPGRPHAVLLDGWSSLHGSSLLVGGEGQLALLGDAERARALEALEDGRVVVYVNRDVETDEVRFVQRRWNPDTDQTEVLRRVTLPAQVVEVEGGHATGVALVPAALADEFDGAVTTAGLAVASQVDEDDEEAIRGALADVSPHSTLYIERGYERDVFSVVLLWILGGVGGVLMLGGTLTATFLSLTDARPDLATVSAVGGTPRTRRHVAAAYALLVAAVGALLGALVGFVPGIAVSRPLTTWNNGPDGTLGPFLEIPWLLIGAVVVLLPLVSAAVVWLFSRSRLPMVARID